jgi:trehalose 6-phosphate synthase
VRARRSLIVVSNRGPVELSRDEDGNRVARRGAGGLVTVLAGLLDRHDVTWIASALTDEDRAAAAEPFDVEGCRLRLVAHDPEIYDRFYNVVANPTIWFIQHSLQELADPVDVSTWNAYAAVNHAFADAVCEELDRRPDAAVFFHDYHLYLAPGIVRGRRPEAALSHFVHIPWPQPDAWRALAPEIVREILEGLLANDVVTLHTARWRENFLRSCAAYEIGVDPERVRFHPASVDPREFDALAGSEAVLEAERRLVAERPEFLVVRVDRTDPSKNVARGFEAFGRLLETRAELQGRVRMLALLTASRQEIPVYADCLADIEREAAAVNERFPGAIDLRIEDDFPASIAAYKQYDVLFVNAVMDGLNLVAKEAPLVNTRDGVVVLSVNTGAYEELAPWTLPVDPFDLDEQAVAIGAALAQPPDVRRANLEAIRAHVRRHDVDEWLDAQLADLDGVG